MASFLSFLRYDVNNALASFLSFLRYGVNNQWRVFLVSCGMMLIINGEFS